MPSSSIIKSPVQRCERLSTKSREGRKAHYGRVCSIFLWNGTTDFSLASMMTETEIIGKVGAVIAAASPQRQHAGQVWIAPQKRPIGCRFTIKALHAAGRQTVHRSSLQLKFTGAPRRRQNKSAAACRFIALFASIGGRQQQKRFCWSKW